MEGRELEQFGNPAGCVPHSCDCDEVASRLKSIHDPIRAHDELANFWVAMFRNGSAELRMLQQHIGPRHQFISEGFCAARIIPRDKANNVSQVVARGRRSDQPASHVASWRLISSCGMPSPRSS